MATAKMTITAVEFVNSNDFKALMRENGSKFVKTVHVDGQGELRETAFNPLTTKYGGKMHEEFTSGGELGYSPKETNNMLVMDQGLIRKARENAEMPDELREEFGHRDKKGKLIRSPFRMVKLTRLKSIKIGSTRFEFEPSETV